MLSKDRLRQSVQKAIEQMPSEVEIKRQSFNEFSEPIDELIRVTMLTGLLYKESSNISVSLQDNVVTSKPKIKFLTAYDNNAKLVKNNDFIYMNDFIYKIIDTGENFEIYFDMEVEKVG